MPFEGGNGPTWYLLSNGHKVWGVWTLECSGCHLAGPESARGVSFWLFLLCSRELAPSPAGDSGPQLSYPPPTPRSLSSPLRLLVILEAELGSQKVPLKTSSTLPVTPDSREGPLSGHQEVLRFHIHAFSLKRKQNMLK